MIFIFFLFDLFGKPMVTPIILPGNFDDIEGCKDAIFPAPIQAWVRFVPRMIKTPALFRPYVFGSHYSTLWWNFVCPWIVLVNKPSCHVSCRHYAWIFFSIVSLMIFSSLSSWCPKLLMFWFRIVHVCRQVSLGRGVPVLMHPTLWGLSEALRRSEVSFVWSLSACWPISFSISVELFNMSSLSSPFENSKELLLLSVCWWIKIVYCVVVGCCIPGCWIWSSHCA